MPRQAKYPFFSAERNGRQKVRNDEELKPKAAGRGQSTRQMLEPTGARYMIFVRVVSTTVILRLIETNKLALAFFGSTCRARTNTRGRRLRCSRRAVNRTGRQRMGKLSTVRVAEESASVFSGGCCGPLHGAQLHDTHTRRRSTIFVLVRGLGARRNHRSNRFDTLLAVSGNVTDRR